MPYEGRLVIRTREKVSGKETMSTEIETTALEDLNKAFKKIGKQYGYDMVAAEFGVFKEFKVQWSRSYRQALFKVSDYMEDAPYEAFESLAATLFARIDGREEVPYKRAMRDWVLSPDFAEKKRYQYIHRSRNLTGSKIGFERDLQDSIDRLADMGLFDKSKGIEASWTINSDSPKAASYSVLFKLIAVSSQLDDLHVPDYVVDYAVYSQYLKIVKGAELFGFTTEVYTRDDEKKFEKYHEAERALDRMSLYL